jgi:hypothetical protein
VEPNAGLLKILYLTGKDVAGAECFNVVFSDAEWLEEFEKYATFVSCILFFFSPFFEKFQHGGSAKSFTLRTKRG